MPQDRAVVAADAAAGISPPRGFTGRYPCEGCSIACLPQERID
jgi:hypothetical protein